VLASQALEQKAGVRVLPVRRRRRPRAHGQGRHRAEPAQRDAEGLIKGRAKAEVCALYLPNTGKQPGDLIAGVTPAKPAPNENRDHQPEPNIGHAARRRS
jgi:hypothetical protein